MWFSQLLVRLTELFRRRLRYLAGHAACMFKAIDGEADERSWLLNCHY